MAPPVPPTLLVLILSHLRRPAFEQRYQTPSPLLAAALVSRQWRAAAQCLLFRSVFLSGQGQVQVWARTEARKWTAELEMVLGREEVGVPLEALLGGGLVNKDGRNGRWLRSLKVGGVEEEDLGEGWGRMEGWGGG